MNPWTRLTDGAGTEFERLLLDSAQSDRVPLASREHVAARLGVDLARIAASGALAPSAARDAVSLTRTGLEPASAGALVKCTLIAVIGGLSAVSATSEVEAVGTPLFHEVRSAEAALPAAPEAVMIESAPVPRSTPLEKTTKLAEPAHRSRTTVKSARKPVAPPKINAENGLEAASTVTDPLLLEVAQLDGVRAALGSGRTRQALRALDEYAAKFPRGALQLEATLLRVRTLERAGRFAHAAELARGALELPGSERYRSELARVAGAEGTPLDKTEHRSTLRESR
jgi:hypothetical protein